MEITPKKSYKVENSEKIRALAADVVRMANASHPMLEETYINFVNESLKAPSFAQMALKNAEYDSYIKATVDANNDVITRADCLNRFKNTRSSLSDLDRSPLGMRLYNAMKEKAIKDISVSPDDKKAYATAVKRAKDFMQKRIAILSGLAEGSRELVPCHYNKAIKKITYRFIKLLNK